MSGDDKLPAKSKGKKESPQETRPEKHKDGEAAWQDGFIHRLSPEALPLGALILALGPIFTILAYNASGTVQAILALAAASSLVIGSVGVRDFALSAARKSTEIAQTPQPKLIDDKTTVPENAGHGDLIKLIGVTDWATAVSSEQSVRRHLEATRSSIKFMGFGFHKYVSYKPAPGGIDLARALERCQDVAGDSARVRILMMNPFSDRIREYSDEIESPGRAAEVQARILDTLKFIEGQRDRGLRIDVRFYPDSVAAKASFRAYIANDEELFVSYYKTRYGHQADDGTFPELSIKRSDQGENFFLPFHGLFAYLWDNGEPASIRTLHLRVRTSQLDEATLAKAKDNIAVSMGKGQFRPDRTVVAAVAGKDSMAVISQLARDSSVDCIIPVIVRIPTEDQEWQTRLGTLAALRRALTRGGCDSKIAPAIALEDDKGVWKDTNAEFQNFGGGMLASPCVGCHFYIHAVRCLIAGRIGVKRVASGDRERHGDRVKLNQVGGVLDRMIEFADRQYGVQLEFPLRHEPDDERVWKLLDGVSPAYKTDGIRPQFRHVT